jgi:hypothetical protein
MEAAKTASEGTADEELRQSVGHALVRVRGSESLPIAIHASERPDTARRARSAEWDLDQWGSPAETAAKVVATAEGIAGTLA